MEYKKAHDLHNFSNKISPSNLEHQLIWTVDETYSQDGGRGKQGSPPCTTTSKLQL